MIIITRYFDNAEDVRTLVSAGRDGQKFNISLCPDPHDGMHFQLEFLGPDVFLAFINHVTAMSRALVPAHPREKQPTSETTTSKTRCLRCGGGGSVLIDAPDGVCGGTCPECLGSGSASETI